MTGSTKLSPHEIIELNEILATEIIGVKKIQTNMSMIKDEELKNFMTKCLDTKKNKINTLRGFIETNTNVPQGGE